MLNVRTGVSLSSSTFETDALQKELQSEGHAGFFFGLGGFLVEEICFLRGKK